MAVFLTYFRFDGLGRSVVLLSNTGFSFSLTNSTDTKILLVYYNRQMMLTTREHMITPLFGVHVRISNISKLSMFK